MRPNKHVRHMNVAREIAKNATCNRASVGALLVRDNRIIATGFNGAPEKMDHCDDVDHDMEDNHCVRTVHAEENAILQCAKYGIATQGATCYCTVSPCFRCFRALYSAGVSGVIFADRYKSMSVEDMDRIVSLIKAGISLTRLDEEGRLIPQFPQFLQS